MPQQRRSIDRATRQELEDEGKIPVEEEERNNTSFWFDSIKICSAIIFIFLTIKVLNFIWKF